MGRRQIPLGLRFKVLRRDKFKCKYCGRTSEEVPLHVDHIVSVADGGTNDMDNLVTACIECNLGKSRTSLKWDEVREEQELLVARLDSEYINGDKICSKLTDIISKLCSNFGPVGYDKWSFLKELITTYDVLTIYESAIYLESNKTSWELQPDQWFKKMRKLCKGIKEAKLSS